ncbi:DUF4184 family protein [Streptomyces sp. CAU 1734]|uniref:DUF4184 family protein n=1 Tax=Streptomyces sp. CAU 1734 TaxID=3140360 RepID=UPI0032611717
MPFTLSHPAAVIPLLRPPFVPAALIAGAMAPDVPYFLAALGLSVTSRTWYEPFLNATTSHSPAGAITVTLPLALVLVAGHRLLRGPVSALLPALPAPAPPRDPAVRARARYAAWLLLSALIGIATHIVWDSFTHSGGQLVDRVAFLREPGPGGPTPARLLQHLSTAAGLVVIGVHLHRRRRRPRTPRPAGTAPLTPVVRWGAAALLVLAALLGAAAHTRGIDTYRQVTVTDTGSPIVRESGGAVTEITYPTRTENAPWTTVAEGMLSDAAKGAGAGLVVALLLYAALWHGHRVFRAARRPGRNTV